MKSRWPLKQTMLIRWSAASFRPTIKIGSAQPERPAAVRQIRLHFGTVEHGPVDNGPIWI